MSEAGERLSANVREFINAHIDSVGNLEALLLFKKNPAKEWTAESMSQELRTDPHWTSRQITWLLSKNFIVVGSEKNFYRYGVVHSETDQTIENLMKAYATKRVAVISLISDRIGQMREFANAFLFRKDKETKNDG